MNQHSRHPQVAFRAPPHLIERIDRAGTALCARRSTVVLRAVVAGLPALEDEALSLLTAELDRRFDEKKAALTEALDFAPEAECAE